MILEEKQEEKPVSHTFQKGADHPVNQGFDPLDPRTDGFWRVKEEEHACVHR
jgi:hypothetical protein